MTEKIGVLLIITLFTILSLSACSAHDFVQGERGGSGPATDQQHATAKMTNSIQSEQLAAETLVVDLTNKQGLLSIIGRLASDRVVYVGETHDNYGHHLYQLEVIRQLHQRNPNIAIGLEFFQQPFQTALDEYIAGRLSEPEMLLQTEWYDRWRFDYRLYRPILRYAREQGIPVVALNVSSELIGRVSAVGLNGLKDAERRQLPRDFDRSDSRYIDRIQAVYRGHPQSPGSNFDRFLDVQLTWDEGMAERVVGYLREHTDKNMIVLAGSGHLMYGTGIPNRVQRRLPIKSHILLPGDSIDLNPDIADFVVFPKQVDLPKAGLMGVLLDKGEKGVLVSSVVQESAAAAAGIEQGDLIVRLNDAAVSSMADIRIGMLDKKPGDRIHLEILRKRLVLGERVLQLELVLGGQ